VGGQVNIRVGTAEEDNIYSSKTLRGLVRCSLVF
jgi:hypothetical protein